MSWIQTYSGRAVRPLQAEPGPIELVDIAHSLSLQCRFNGHCRVHYSVAEHSVRVSRAVPEQDALWGLLHDATEAYLGDLPRPIKLLLPEYERAEDTMMRLIAGRFGLPWPMPPSVARADRLLLATEARDLMAPPPEDWGLDAAPLPGRIEPWSAVEAERAFLRRFDELGGTSGE